MQHRHLIRQRLRQDTLRDVLESVRESVVFVADVQVVYTPAAVDELLFAQATLGLGVFTPLETYVPCDGGPTCLTNLHFAVFDPREFDWSRFALAGHLSLDYAICYALRGLVPVRTPVRWLSSEPPPRATESSRLDSFERLEGEQTD